jgi:hypothetical protein
MMLLQVTGRGWMMCAKSCEAWQSSTTAVAAVYRGTDEISYKGD